MKHQIGTHAIEVDEDDLWRLLDEPWGIQRSVGKYKTYAYVRKTVQTNGAVKVRLLHREIMNAKAGELVDHINGDTLDNRKSNLRICTHSENMCNRATNGSSKTGLKGVYWCKDKAMYRAHVRLNGKKHHAGYAHTAAEAGRLYDAKARQLHGEFARSNTPAAVTA
jgi:hypothetical protein